MIRRETGACSPVRTRLGYHRLFSPLLAPLASWVWRFPLLSAMLPENTIAVYLVWFGSGPSRPPRELVGKCTERGRLGPALGGDWIGVSVFPCWGRGPVARSTDPRRDMQDRPPTQHMQDRSGSKTARSHRVRASVVWPVQPGIWTASGARSAARGTHDRWREHPLSSGRSVTLSAMPVPRASIDAVWRGRQVERWRHKSPILWGQGKGSRVAWEALLLCRRTGN
jgi:hypothetical protein